MKKFLLKILLFALVTALAGLGLDRLVTAGLKKTQAGSFQTWTDIFGGRIDADVLIMGASRASRQISTEILDSVLKVNSYNLGGDSYYFYMQNMRYDVYRKYNKKPKLIIQSADLMTFAKSPTTIITQYAPYMGDTVISSRLESVKSNAFDVDNLRKPVLRYSSQTSAIKLGLLNALNFNYNPKSEHSYKGYLPMDKVWDGRAFLELLKKDSINLYGFENEEVFILFDNYLQQCRDENIKVVMVFTPLYRPAFEHSRGKDRIMQSLYGFSAKYDVPFLNYSGDSICYNEKYFYNALHLNRLGAEIFSKKLAEDLKNVEM